MNRKLFYNASIITEEEDLPYANYIAVTAEGRIEAIGVSCEDGLRRQYCGVEQINLGGRCVVPGFIDSHLHMLTGALTKLQVDLNGKEFSEIAELLQFIEDRAPSQEGWIRSFGFDEERVGERRLLTRQDMDRQFPRRPVIITRVCGHVSMINSAALSLLEETSLRGITGGEFQKDEEGRFNGIATEAAQQAVLDCIPAPRAEDILTLLEAEQDSLLQKGICSIHDAGTDQLPVADYIAIYEKFNETNKLKLRTCLMVRPIKDMVFEAFAAYVKALKASHSPEESRLFFGAVKLFADGSIGGKTAAVYKEYQGEPGNVGLLLEESLQRYIKSVHLSGLQLAVHAIGDRGTEYVADLMIAAMGTDGNHIRHRIEHGELETEALIRKLADNGLLVMTQPGFIGEFQESYRRNLGEADALRIQPIKTMLKSNIHMGFGSDYPVMDADPLWGIDCAVNRRQRNGEDCLNKEEGIELDAALKCYTVGNAYASYTEHLQGSLAVGKFADFVVMNCMSEELLPETEGLAVEKTVIGGEILYEK